MSDILVFPGFNALVAENDRTRFLQVPQVLNQLKIASEVLSKARSEKIDLVQLCLKESETLYEIKNAPLTAAAITAIQVGLYEEVKNKLSSETWLMGCSLGDIGRTICTGSIDFEEVIHLYAEFSSLADSLGGIGFNSAIFSKDPVTLEQYEVLETMNLSLSIMSPYFVNVAGANQMSDKLTEYAQSQKWRLQRILNFPAHSNMLESYILPFWEKIPKGIIKKPQHRLFSSLSCKELFENTEIQNEVYLNMITPVRWAESVEFLIREHKISRMINIGPCESLPKITKRSGYELEFINGWELV